jgi:glycosyltransferase involved in cell wall biosynthesis
VWDDRAAGLELCRAADVVFVLTLAEGESLVRAGVDASRLVAVAQGPKLEGEADPAGFRRRHGVRGPLVLFLGRKMASKGYHLLLGATSDVWRAVPEAVFVFVGPRVDPDCATVFARHADPRVVELEGLDEREKHSALAASDLVCVPTTADVFPLAFAEAWHCGKPVVSGRFAGADEVVRDGVDGLLVDPRPPAVAAAVTRLLCDARMRAELGARGRERARAELTWAAVVERVVNGYRTAAPRSYARV